MPKKKPSFEASLTRLEEIVERMERGDLPLDESLALFQEGVGLSQTCIRQLDAAEKEIQKLVRIEDGKFILEPFSSDDYGTSISDTSSTDYTSDNQEQSS